MALFLAHLNSRIYEATAWQVIFQTMNLPGSTEREAKKFCHNVLMTINTNSYPSILRKLGEPLRRALTDRNWKDTRSNYPETTLLQERLLRNINSDLKA